MEGGAVGHNFERDPHRDHPSQVWFNLVQRFQRRRFKCDLLSKYAFKIMCNTPIFYFNFRCQIENQVSDYRLLGASS
jgi:hypothetical protein